MEYLEEFDGQTYKINRDEASPTVTYVGFAIAQDASDSAAKWMIKRIALAGALTTVTYASQKFDKVWNDRVSYFGAPPFANENSLIFDGINDFVNIGDVAPLQFERTDSFSFSLWVRSTALNNQSLFSKQGSGNAAGYRVALASGRFELHLSGGAAGNRIEVRTPLNTYADGNWHHVVFAYSGTSLASGCACYIDGATITLDVIANTLVSTIATTVAAMQGARNTGTTDSFTGFLDELAVFDVALTSGEATEIYNSGAPEDLNQHSQAANLTAWWRNGDQDTLPTILDFSSVGNNLDGTCNNMIAASITGEVP